MKTTIKNNVFGSVLFLVFALIGFYTYQDYGLSSDEHPQHHLGEFSYKYVTENDPTYTWYGDNDYGVATEMPLYFIVDVLLRKTDSQEIFQTRHLVLHLLFLISCFVFFLLTNRIFKDKYLSFLGALMLLLHPRIYGHSFFNSKDLPLLSFTIIGLYILFRFIENRKFIWLILLSLISALIINNRIIGLMFYAIVISLFGFVFIYEKKERKTTIKQLVFFTVISLLFLYITWPILWKNPVLRLGIIFRNMAHFRWEDYVLFKGEIIQATELPWNYILYWFSVTTPILILGLGFSGMISTIYTSMKRIKEILKDKVHFFMLLNAGIFFIPIVIVALLNSILYDGWRHLYFIYPSFILLSVYFLSKIKTSWLNEGRKALLYVCLAFLLFLDTGVFMLQNHPNHQVYFNSFLAKDEALKNNMELDYWGLSYHNALEYILEKDSTSKIKIAYETGICKKNAAILTPEQRRRLSFTEAIDSADYFVTNYRWHMIKDSSFSETLNYAPFYDLKVGETSIMTAWKLHE